MRMKEFKRIMKELIAEEITPHYSHFQMNYTKYLKHLKKYEEEKMRA